MKKWKCLCTVVEPIQDLSVLFPISGPASQAASEGPIWHVHSSQNGQHETHHEPEICDMSQGRFGARTLQMAMRGVLPLTSPNLPDFNGLNLTPLRKVKYVSTCLGTWCFFYTVFKYFKNLFTPHSTIQYLQISFSPSYTSHLTCCCSLCLVPS